MFVSTSTDAAAFAAIAAPVIEAEPILHSVTASAVHDAILGGDVDDRFYTVERPGRGPFLAHHTPPYPFHLPASDPDAAALLARHVWAEGRRPDAVGGHSVSVAEFAAEWTRLSGLRAEVRMRLGMYDLPGRVRLPWPVPGRMRQASGCDVELLSAWWSAFFVEAVGRPAPDGSAMQAAVEEREVMLWCNPEPVAMARARPGAGGVTRISGVYTPPEFRGRGYGSAVTAAVSADRQGAGLRCMLYTDLANPTSNGIYQAMGYRHLMDTVELAFVG